MISVGHRTGLFDKLTEIGGASSEQLSSAASLNERYVREWLGAMTVSGIVNYDEAARKYSLPPEQAHLLIANPAKIILQFFAQYVSVLGSVEDEIIECFHKGGGVLTRLTNGFTRSWLRTAVSHWCLHCSKPFCSLVDGLAARMEQGIDVMDIGCGSGISINAHGKSVSEEQICRI